MGRVEEFKKRTRVMNEVWNTIPYDFRCAVVSAAYLMLFISSAGLGGGLLVGERGNAEIALVFGLAGVALARSIHLVHLGGATEWWRQKIDR